MLLEEKRSILNLGGVNFDKAFWKQYKTTLSTKQTLGDGDTQLKPTFSGRHSLMEDTMDKRQPFMEDGLWWNT